MLLNRHQVLLLSPRPPAGAQESAEMGPEGSHVDGFEHGNTHVTTIIAGGRRAGIGSLSNSDELAGHPACNCADRNHQEAGSA
eukprot:687284-Alexandrium_andersonii.AAC.2